MRTSRVEIDITCPRCVFFSCLLFTGIVCSCSCMQISSNLSPFVTVGPLPFTVRLLHHTMSVLHLSILTEVCDLGRSSSVIKEPNVSVKLSLITVIQTVTIHVVCMLLNHNNFCLFAFLPHDQYCFVCSSVKRGCFLVLKRKCGLPVMAKGVNFLVTQAACNPSVGSSPLRFYPQTPPCVNWDLKPQERLCVYNSCHNAANKPLKNIDSSRMWLGWRSMHLACTHKQLSDVSNWGCVRAQKKVR